MMLTVAEAKTKWCPFARESQEGVAVNRPVDEEWPRCIANDCMAWKWREVSPLDPRREAERRGACGLAVDMMVRGDRYDDS